MTKISINLLPQEFTEAEVKRAKFYKIQAIGVSAILLVIFLSSLIVALRILQSSSIEQIQSRLSESEAKIQNLKDKQSQLLLLKDRLTAINLHFGTPSKQTSAFKLLDKLIPNLSVSSFSIDKTGDAQITTLIQDTTDLENLITNLTSIENNEGKITSVAIESLTRGRDGFYRLSMKIKSN